MANIDSNLELLLGQYVALWCGVFIYSGKLVGVGTEYARLTDTGVVYETGPLGAQLFKDFERLPGPFWLVRLASVESVGLAPGHPDAD